MAVKQNLDKYYTPVSEVERFCDILLPELGDLEEVEFIEPSAGDGRWCNVLFRRGIRDIKGYDLEPDGIGIIQQDFLKLSLPEKIKTRVFLGNPPFSAVGGAGAVGFFNHCDKLSADVIAMVLPASFGVKLQSRSRISKNFSLYRSVPIDNTKHFEVLDGTEYKGKNILQCNFMIWVRKDRSSTEVPLNPAYTVVRPPNKKLICEETNKSREQGVGDLDVDFSIITHGTRAGTVLDFCPTHKVSVKQFVKVNEGYCKTYWRDKFINADYDYFKYSNVMQQSISTEEIKCCVENSDYKLIELSYTSDYKLLDYIRKEEN